MSKPEQQARSLFLQADHLHRGGKIEQAYLLFQQVHLVSPASFHGQRAMERVHQIETEHRNTSTPKPGGFTIPLGTVDDDFI